MNVLIVEIIHDSTHVSKRSEKSDHEQFLEFKDKLLNDPSYKWLLDALKELKVG